MNSFSESIIIPRKSALEAVASKKERKKMKRKPLRAAKGMTAFSSLVKYGAAQRQNRISSLKNAIEEDEGAAVDGILNKLSSTPASEMIKQQDKNANILRLFEPGNHYKVNRILAHIKRFLPEIITWDPRSFEVTIGGTLIPKSSLIDILHFLISPTREPYGHYLSGYTRAELKPGSDPSLMDNMAIPRGVYQFKEEIVKRLPSRTSFAKVFSFAAKEKMRDLNRIYRDALELEVIDLRADAPIDFSRIKKEEVGWEQQEEAEEAEIRRRRRVVDERDEEASPVFRTPPSMVGIGRGRGRFTPKTAEPREVGAQIGDPTEVPVVRDQIFHDHDLRQNPKSTKQPDIFDYPKP